MIHGFVSALTHMIEGLRLGHADENLVLLRCIGLNLSCQEKSSRVGIHAKRLKAGWGS